LFVGIFVYIDLPLSHKILNVKDLMFLNTVIL